VPVVVAAVTIAIETKTAIRAYSMAVAPFSLLAKKEIRWCIANPLKEKRPRVLNLHRISDKI
jgi:hypothetical protein